MNIRTNFYGAIGLVSTIGKNGFAAGQQAGKFGENAFWGIRQVVEVNVAGVNVFETLETTSKKVKEFDKWAGTKCQEWEDWAEQKRVEAKAKEDLNKDWKQNVNEGVKTKHEEWQELAQEKVKWTKTQIKKQQQKFFPQTKLATPEKAVYRPNCLRYLGVYLNF